MTVGGSILKFYRSLSIEATLPPGVEVMNPYLDETTFQLTSRFFKRFYNDRGQRTMIMGINPGRFGAGVTGVPFTDPIKLEQCGIPNTLKKKTELSADYVYTMIDAYGGPEKFYGKFYISALSPLGFTKDGKNLNYYDIRELQNAIEPYMIACIETQLGFGVNREICFCLGEGKNFDYLSRLNAKHRFFKTIVPLAHPRFIMQYKRKSIQLYVKDYLTKLASA
jgi:hypothetical protein